jgi:3'-phosphoadenosine 5'-phosphosulfate sulfotransferase (PAPS reductase)/FAD synthetase
MRLRLIRQLGPIGFKKRRYYYAIWDWKTADVKAYLEQHQIKLSKSYLYFGSTGDGIEYTFLHYLKDNLPDDYRKVLDVFPMADIELFRYESVQ